MSYDCHSERSRPTLSPMSAQSVIPSGAGRRFFFHVRSCERVGLRSEESLFDFYAIQRCLFDKSLFDFNFVFPDPKSSCSSNP